MSLFHYQSMYKNLPCLSLGEFLDSHGDDEIVLCSDAIHAETVTEEEVRRWAGEDADVEYLGERSEWWDGTDRLFFQIVPASEDGTPELDEAFEVVVCRNE